MDEVSVYGSEWKGMELALIKNPLGARTVSVTDAIPT